jgi:hypothetical protein
MTAILSTLKPLTENMVTHQQQLLKFKGDILMLLVINAKHREEKHISWFVKRKVGVEIQDKLGLYEVVERKYPHPDAPDRADVIVIEILFVKEAYVNSKETATWVLLEACQNAVTTEKKDGD